jgi:hypothetical protein
MKNREGAGRECWRYNAKCNVQSASDGLFAHTLHVAFTTATHPTLRCSGPG